MLDALIDDLTGTFSAVEPQVAAARLIAAVILGGAIGLEREAARRPAGLRTHMLIALAACLFILIGQELSYVAYAPGADLRIDPLRLIEAVTAGVAFLAAGVIFTSGGTVRNLTTGASMWLAGAVGLACGAGRMPLALMATAISLIVLVLISRAEKILPIGTVPEHLREKGPEREDG